VVRLQPTNQPLHFQHQLDSAHSGQKFLVRITNAHGAASRIPSSQPIWFSSIPSVRPSVRSQVQAARRRVGPIWAWLFLSMAVVLCFQIGVRQPGTASPVSIRPAAAIGSRHPGQVPAHSLPISPSGIAVRSEANRSSRLPGRAAAGRRFRCGAAL
jgi:hypothetical protein